MAAGFLGAEVRRVPLTDWAYDVDAILAEVDERTKIVWLTTPNNPTGNILSEAQIARLMQEVPEGVVLAFDEAYYEFATACADYPRGTETRFCDGGKVREEMAVLRTFSKIYGLAGLRIGYMFTSERIAERMNALNLTFGVNRVAEAAARAALADEDYLRKVISGNKEALDGLCRFFDERGLFYVKPYGNFIWVDIQGDSEKMFHELQRRGVIIRPGYLWGYPSFMRVSTGTETQMAAFEREFEAVASG
jgi:histidinol-phosphate aminotransferase